MSIVSKIRYIYDANLRRLPLRRKLSVSSRLIGSRILMRGVPLSMMLGLTYRCQCHCVHCCIGRHPVSRENEITTKEAIRIIDEATALGVCKVRFFGGEPLLREDLFYLSSEASKKGLIVSMDTNGFLLTASVAKKLKESGMCEVDISIDSCDSATHDALRSKAGSHQRALEAARDCIREGLAVILSTYVTKDLIARGDLPRIIELGKKIKATGVKILFPVAAGRWLENTAVILDENEKSYVSRFIDNSFVFFEGQGNSGYKSCSMLKKEIFYVSPYADVQACCFVPMIFGNLRTDTLRTVWEKMSRHQLYSGRYTPCVMNDPDFRKSHLEVPGSVRDEDK